MKISKLEWTRTKSRFDPAFMAVHGLIQELVLLLDDYTLRMFEIVHAFLGAEHARAGTRYRLLLRIM